MRRVAQLYRPQFYAKGSYVLDVLFGTKHASDIDICWADTGGQPEKARISRWMELCGFEARPIQLVRVTDFFACDGGGPPIFNIDLWRIEMDGAVYEMDPVTRVATRIRSGRSTVTLRFLPNLPPVCARAIDGDEHHARQSSREDAATPNAG